MPEKGNISWAQVIPSPWNRKYSILLRMRLAVSLIPHPVVAAEPVSGVQFPVPPPLRWAVAFLVPTVTMVTNYVL